jgi:hypothetical protein
VKASRPPAQRGGHGTSASIVTVLLAAGYGCGARTIRDNGPIEAGSPGEAADIVALSEWTRQLGAAICAKDTRCESELGPTLANEAACVASFVQGENWGLYFGGASSYATVTRYWAVAPDEVRAACLRAIEASTCVLRLDQIHACDGVLVPKNPIPAGGACVADSRWKVARPCATGFVCRGGSATACGACGPAQFPNGQACEYDDDCADGRCQLASDGRWVCGATDLLKAAGERCASFADCAGNLECTLGQVSTCVARAWVGEACGGAGLRSCVGGAECTAEGGEGVCAPLLLDGAACPRVRDPSRACANWCLFPSPDAMEGTCGIAKAEPGPCAAFRADHSLFCPWNTYMEAGPDAGPYPAPCACKERGERGAPCASDDQCAYGPCRSGICTAPERGIGDGCGISAECVSTYCDPATLRCAELPVLHCSD